MLSTLLLTLCLALSIIYLYFKNTRTAKLLDKIPGPPAWPLVGNLFSLLVSPVEIWTILRNWSMEYHKVFKFSIGTITLVNINDADNAEILLTNTRNLDKDRVYDFLIPWLGTGLLISPGAHWKLRRKILSPAFHFNILRKYFDIMVENGEKTIQSLNTDDFVVENLLAVLDIHTLNVICESAMGTSLRGKSYDIVRYKKSVHFMGELIVERLFRPWLRPTCIYNLTSTGKKQNGILQILHGFSESIIRERKEYHKQTNYVYLNEFHSDKDQEKESEVNDIFGYKKKRLAMLDLLIAANKNGEEIDDKGIREEVDTFCFAGHDTSAVGLCFALLLIAENKDVQTKIREEVNEIFNNSNGKLGYAEIQQMNYLERCVKESLRIYPSVPHVIRKLTEDLQLKEYCIPKGTSVNLHIIQIHRNPEDWPDPLKFDPDRFLPEKSQGRHPYSYIPFSAGPRNCIGQKFAMMELKSLLAQIIRNYYLEPIDLAHEIPLQLDMVIRPTRPIKMKFIPIKKLN